MEILIKQKLAKSEHIAKYYDDFVVLSKIQKSEKRSTGGKKRSTGALGAGVVIAELLVIAEFFGVFRYFWVGIF